MDQELLGWEDLIGQGWKDALTPHTGARQSSLVAQHLYSVRTPTIVLPVNNSS